MFLPSHFGWTLVKEHQMSTFLPAKEKEPCVLRATSEFSTPPGIALREVSA